jgi:hypothetical protein
LRTKDASLEAKNPPPRIFWLTGLLNGDIGFVLCYKTTTRRMAMPILEGLFSYYGWEHPWVLKTETGEINVWPLVRDSLRSLHGKKARHISYDTAEIYSTGEKVYVGCWVEVDPNSDMRFEALGEEDHNFVLVGNGVTNVGFYLRDALLWLNGRRVKLETTPERLHILANPKEEVLGISFHPRHQVCCVPSGMERVVCKFDKGTEACIFFAPDPVLGNICTKFSYDRALARLELLRAGRRRGRIGNCKLVAPPREAS